MHKFNPVAFAAQKQAKADHEANKQATPNPNSVPQLWWRGSSYLNKR